MADLHVSYVLRVTQAAGSMALQKSSDHVRQVTSVVPRGDSLERGTGSIPFRFKFLNFLHTFSHVLTLKAESFSTRNFVTFPNIKSRIRTK